MREKVRIKTFILLFLHNLENLGVWLYQLFQYKLAESPEPSDAEEESSDEEEDGFGPKKEVNDDPVARKKPSCISLLFHCSHFQKPRPWQIRRCQTH